MENQIQETVVEASVDAEQYETPEQDETTLETPTEGAETVVQTEVDAPTPKPNVGDAIKREVERREAQLKKQYEEQMSAVQQQNAYLEKMARIEGFNNVQDYLKAIDEYERKQQIEAEARRLGIDTDTYAQHFAPVTQEVQQLRQELNTYKAQLTEKQQQEQAQAQWGALYNAYPHLVDDAKEWEKGENPNFYNEQMQSYIAKGYEPKDAYELAHKETLFKAKEQEVLARVTGRDQRQVLPSTDQPNNLQFDPANMTSDDILKISERVQRGERITF